ncbi:uncharacterized protein LOC142582172 isoform X2 [Dermacentor variabilis]|uniref:uncharacterized protein LOC142582172 isoform X2 n=1 Tax=Dermacentor variabilis TaxID=34621 RepID=UPI003F5C9918
MTARMDSGMFLALVTTLALLAKVGSGLRLLRLDVPSVARRGEPVWLNCSYDLERDQLYSIKWYKNNVEIYRYLPSETPRVKVYNMPGIHIDVSRSNISDLYLNDTDLNSEGKYRCEVSAESPSFQTERAQQEMLMYVLPLEDPVIRGLRSQYQIGDPVNLTCSYGPSKPNASLTWYINDRKVPTGSEEVVENGHFLDAEGLWHAHSRVTFVAQPSHFWHGAMEVRCASHAALPYFVSSEELTVRDYGRTLDVSGPRMHGPRLEGTKKRYSLGSAIDLSCLADAPLRELKWLINDREAQDSYVSSPSNGHGAAVMLRLNFRLGEQHFSKGELRLKCVSRQLREFTAASELRVPISDKRHSSGLQVYFARANGGRQHAGLRGAVVLLLVVSRLLAAST